MRKFIYYTNECTLLYYITLTYYRSDIVVLSNPNDIYLIGVVDDKIIAHSKITIIETMYQNMNVYAILNHVCVKEEYRRHNIATKMLEEIEKICLDRGCKTMELWSNNVRVPAHACYKNYGFHLDDAGFFSKKIGEGVVL